MRKKRFGGPRVKVLKPKIRAFTIKLFNSKLKKMYNIHKRLYKKKMHVKKFSTFSSIRNKMFFLEKKQKTLKKRLFREDFVIKTFKFKMKRFSTLKRKNPFRINLRK